MNALVATILAFAVLIAVVIGMATLSRPSVEPCPAPLHKAAPR